MWNALLAPLVILITSAIAVGYLLIEAGNVTPAVKAVVLSAAGLIAVIAIAWSLARASAAAREAHADLGEVRAMIPRGPEELRTIVERWQRGERPLPPERPGPDASDLRWLVYELDRFRGEAVDAVARSGNTGAQQIPSPNGAVVPQPAAAPAPGPNAPTDDQRIGVFVNLARRLQSLVQREIQLLDDLEAEVEDPELLKGLFAVDHLATRIRRHAENLAVLGGAVSHRQWSRPVNTYVVLRSAVAEVEQYARVKLIRPIDGTLKGHAVADVIHLIAELVENAATFSNPSTQVLLRAQKVTAGIALEVEDRGLGMPREDQQRLNSMLASPGQVDVTELLSDGRIGLYVVSTLAQRHGIAVQLQTNIYGGIQAVIVLPHALLGEPEQRESRRAIDNHDVPAPIPTPEPMPRRQIDTEPPPPVVPAAFGGESPADPLGETPVPVSAAPVSVSGAPAAASVSGVPASVSGAPIAGAAPVSGAPGSASVSGVPGPASVAGASPISAPPAEPSGVKRPRPYVGRGDGTGGIPSVTPDPRPGDRAPVPSYSATEVASAGAAEARPQPRPRPTPETAAPEVTFTSVTDPTPSRYEPDNPNESTGVLDMSALRNGDMSTPDAAGGPSEPATPSAGSDGPDPRPRLPQRRRQTHLAPELRQAPVVRDEKQTEHNPGLMSAFQQGVNRAAPADEDAEVRADGAT